MSGRVIAAFAQFFDGAGDPLSYGWIKFLESGSNNTLKDTYNDPDLNIANSNPVRLDGEGRCPSIFGEGRYRVVTFQNDPNDETTPGQMIQSFDPVTAQGETSGGGGGSTFEVWDNATDYVVGDIVTHSSKYYRSIANFNINKNPAVEDGYWEEIEFLAYWNENVDYDIGELVRDGGNLYFSTIANNLNNIPSSSPVEWRRVDYVYLTTDEFIVSYNVLITDKDKLLVYGSTAIASGTFTLPAVTADHDGFILNFYNASDYDLSVTASVPSTLWLSNTIILKKGSYLRLQYNYDYDKWLPIGNSGPSLGGQDLGTVVNPVLSTYLNSMYFVGDFDINLATVALWRFHSDGTFYPLGTNTLPNIGTVADQVEDFWQDGYHYFLDSDNWMTGDLTKVQINAKTSIDLTTTADPTKYIRLNNTAIYLNSYTVITGQCSISDALDVTGSIYSPVTNTYNLGGVSYEWANLYIGTGSVFFNGTKGYVKHTGTALTLYSTLSFEFLSNAGTSFNFWVGGTLKYNFNANGNFAIPSDGSSVINNISFGSGGPSVIWHSANIFHILTTGHLQFYTNATARWYMDDTTGNLYPYLADTYQIGHPSNEVRSIYLGSIGAYFGTSQQGRIYYDGTWGLLLQADKVGGIINGSNFRSTAIVMDSGDIYPASSTTQVYKMTFTVVGPDGRTYSFTGNGPLYP